MKDFSVLQYNVHKSKDRVMAPLLADPQTREFDVLAIQEPWQNPYVNATYCPQSSGFTPAYNDKTRRSCFLVNKRLPSNSWSVTYPSEDLCVLRINLGERTTWIYNVYSQPPGGYSVTDYPSPVGLLSELLARQGEHLVLGDFNLHHPLWSGLGNPTVHLAAEHLIETLYGSGLTLTTPPGQTTWQRQSSSSTIDLTFATEGLVGTLVECRTRRESDHGSDHLPVITTFSLTGPKLNLKRQRNWKDVDTELTKIGARPLDVSRPLNSPEELDQYVTYLTDFIADLSSHTVPWRKPSVKGESWWNESVKKAVHQEREARNLWRETRSDALWQEAQARSQAKRQIIRKAKTKDFRDAIHKATEGEGIWRLAKWGRNPTTALPTIPPLVTDQGLAITTQDKADALRKRFYPAVTAELDDITDPDFPKESFSDSFEVKKTTDLEEIQAILGSRASSNAPGPDDIPYGFLKAMGSPLTTALAHLANGSWKTGYYPQKLKEARTVVIRKPSKPTYTEAGSWRPIALLNTLGKVVETLTARRIREAAETHLLLPKEQMGGRQGRSTETALDLLTRQIREVWKGDKKQVASLLSIDISGAFDTVHHIRLLATLRTKRYPFWIVQWIKSFLTNRKTTLILFDEETDQFSVEAGVPQGSPLSPILFMLYNSELFELCRNPRIGLSCIGFADDLNILAYGSSTEANCSVLEQAHERCVKWARKFGIKFAPQKYELIHFSTATKRYNMAAPVRIQGIEKLPTKDVRILGVWFDSKLKWSAHTREIKKKMSKQVGALLRISTSTWGATFRRSRIVYNSVVRPAMSYAAGVWHTPALAGQRPKGIAAKLVTDQNRCLRAVTGAYKAVPTPDLETEAYVPPLDLFLDGRVAAYVQRIKDTDVEREIQRACQWIRRRSRKRRNHIVTDLLSTQARWATAREVELGGGTGPKMVQEAWGRRWAAQSRSAKCWDAVTDYPSKRVLKLHQGLAKAESTALTQIRTGRSGLAFFLSKRKVPGYESPNCLCGQPETPKHVLISCPQEELRRATLTDENGRRLSWLELVTDPKRTRATAKWFIQTKRLLQFKIADDILYEGQPISDFRE